MTSTRKIQAIRTAYETAREMLLAERDAGGFWVGRLSSSALSTATAVSALAIVSRERSARGGREGPAPSGVEGFEDLIIGGARWLARSQNADGGWGDTVDSPSSLATTMLARAALALAGDELASATAAGDAEEFLERMAGSSPSRRVDSLRESYGADRTFAAPILVNCALADHVDWRDVPPLPFELARFPQKLLGMLRLHVVSYALPALIAIGQLLHLRHPARNPFVAVLRDASVKPTLRLLERIQPGSGGYLEATPLTSFVVMSLAAAGRSGHPVVTRGLRFIADSVRDDGSWPIDTDLSTWVTTQAVEALTSTGTIEGADDLRRWLLRQQHLEVHPYTHSPPGGWAWTPLSGGVPDADDTSGALVALSRVGGREDARAAAQGVRWLIDLQNDDGGWPTFCRGWGKLAFDRSTADLTAHALRALHAWHGVYHPTAERTSMRRGLAYLRRTQAADGSWIALWFGNQHQADHANPVYGTARVLAALVDLGRGGTETARRGAAFLAAARNRDGGWGGAKDIESTIEETALATTALARCPVDEGRTRHILRGCAFLADRIAEGGLAKPAPIGLYFASLWYAEKLYPVIWSVAALGAALRLIDPES